jgi:ornithine decarboxylase
VYKDVPLPLLRNGDFLVFPRAGAYTVAGACDFNGIEFTTPNKFYVYSEAAVDLMGSVAEEGEQAAPRQAAA